MTATATIRRRLHDARLRWLRVVLAIGVVLINLTGAVVVFCLAALVVPMPEVARRSEVRWDNLLLAAAYVVVAVVVGLLRGLSISRDSTAWLFPRRRPTEAEQRALLRAPGRLFTMQAALWTLAAFVFFGFNAHFSWALASLVLVIVLIAGLTSSTVTYLVAERAMRPYAVRALASGVPQQIGMRLGLRTVLSWLLGSGLATLGISLSGITALSQAAAHGHSVTPTRLAITMVVLGGTAFLVGGLTTWLAAKAGSDPVRALRESVDAVGRGDLGADVPIYDGTELGVLQAGFNEMLHGLRERETIRDLFGRHVGDDVARAALEGGVRLGGEVRRVAVLFVDIVGSTSMAQQRPPEEVVALLNRFFDVVIEVVHAEGGWINKFEGDAALAVWGAPTGVDDLEARVLRAARVLADRLAAAVPELSAGIGVSVGDAVAGNVGAAQRYEYTVIGDPVNEAARLTEVAKGVPGLVAANAVLLEGAAEEAAHWRRADSITLRGRSAATEVAVPAD
ncbi:MAG: adenylate/guanylate cyclase domain-containing protein [Marmoricola sp.]